MKKIKLFLSATEQNLMEDRMAIADLLGVLNDKYEEKELYFQLVKPKEPPKEADLADCRMAFILWFQQSDEITTASFESALNNFQKAGNPKIVTYFKQSGGADIGDDVAGFMERLDRQLGHYYNLYEHIDSLRFSILMQISALEQSISLEMTNGNVVLDGEKLMPVSEVPCVAGNAVLTGLKADFKKITAKFYELRELHADNEDDDSIMDEYITTSEKRSKLREQIAEMEKNILAAALSMARDVSSGAISERQKEAYRLFEKGDLTGANEVLDFDEIKSDIQEAESVADIAQTKLKTGINELLQKIGVLKAGILTEAEYTQIDNCYEEAIRIEQQYNLPKTAMESYLFWLRDHHQNMKAITLGEKLLLFRKLEEGETLPVIEVLANLYYLIQNPDKARELCNEILNTAEDERNNIALYHMNAAVLLSRIFSDEGKQQEMRKMSDLSYAEYKKIDKLLLKERKFFGEVRAMFMQWASSLREVDRYEDAIKSTQAGIEDILRALPNDKAYFMPILISTEIFLGKLYFEMGLLYEAKSTFLTAKQHSLDALQEDRIKFGALLAEIHLYLSYIYCDCYFPQKALEEATAAIISIKPVFASAPETHWMLMAECHCAYCFAQYSLGYYEDGAEHAAAALQLSEKYQKKPEHVNNKVIMSELYLLIAKTFNMDLERGETILDYFERAATLAKQAANQRGNCLDIRLLAGTHKDIAISYLNYETFWTDAKEDIDYAIKIYETHLMDKISRVYLSAASAYCARATYYYMQHDYDAALKDAETAIMIIFEEHPEPEDIKENARTKLAEIYKIAANCFCDTDDYQRAYEFFDEAYRQLKLVNRNREAADLCSRTIREQGAVTCMMAYTMKKLGEQEKAYDLYREAVSVLYTNPQLKDPKGRMESALDCWAQMISVLRNVEDFISEADEPGFSRQAALELLDTFLERLENVFPSEGEDFLQGQKAALWYTKGSVIEDDDTDQDRLQKASEAYLTALVLNKGHFDHLCGLRTSDLLEPIRTLSETIYSFKSAVRVFEELFKLNGWSEIETAQKFEVLFDDLISFIENCKSFKNIKEDEVEYNRNSSEYREALRSMKEDMFDFWFEAGMHKTATSAYNDAIPMLETCVELNEKILDSIDTDGKRAVVVSEIKELIKLLKEQQE